jgi:ABC-2 type transport system ATP-binding protein
MISIIDKGQIVKTGSPAALKASLGKESLNLAFENRENAEAANELLAQTAERTQLDRVTLRVYRADIARAIPHIMEQLHDAGLDPVSLTLTQPTLDDVFLQVTGSAYEAEAAASQAQPGSMAVSD